MIQNQNTYHIEKMIQHRQAEIDRNIRQGLYVRQIQSNSSEGLKKSDVQRGLWHKWFGSKRLNTSWK